VHLLASPVAIYHLLQDHLTLVDLGLDRETREFYLVAKQMAQALAESFAIAAVAPALPYTPYSPKSQPFQGLPAGRLEAAGQALVVPGRNGASRVMRFGEFDEAYADKDGAVYRCCSPLAEIMYGFHPRTHPVLWRILIVEAHLCKALISRRDRLESAHGAEHSSRFGAPWNAISEDERREYDWRTDSGCESEQFAVIHPFDAARTYLQSRLSELRY
jgi:hypothetical protein